jgi:hypothetical protein
MFLAGYWIVATQNLVGIGWGVKELILNIHTYKHTFAFIYKKKKISKIIKNIAALSTEDL